MGKLTEEQIKAAREVLNHATYRDLPNLPERLSEHLQYTPASLQGDVIEAMIRQWFSKNSREDSDFLRPDFVRRMTAAATVLLDAIEAIMDEEYNGSSLSVFKSRVRARILKPERTPEERVTIVPNGSGYAVLLDGDHLYGFALGTDNRQDAEIYRLGVIAQLLKREEEEQ